MSFEIKFPIATKSNNFFVIHNGWPYDLSPPPIVKISLPPNIIGIDEVLREGSKIKNINGDFVLTASDEWFFGCDVRAEYKNTELNGWVYVAKSEKLKISDQHVWVCPYLKFYFEEPPKILYMSIGLD